jgi:hypothetical protein
MKRVTDMLGLARSNIAARVRGVRPKRGFAIARWRSRRYVRGLRPAARPFVH